MNWLKGLAVVAVIAVMSGCSDKSEAVKEVVQTPQELVKTSLEGVAETGQGGSEIGMLMQELEKMKADNPSLADSLIKDAEKMMSMNNPSQVKALAKDMLKRLEAGGSGGTTE